MRQLFLAGLFVLMSVPLLTSCASMAMPDSRGSLVSSVEDFAQRLRWKDVNGAVRYLEQDLVQDFRTQFEDNEDLHIVDVRVERVDMPEPTRASVWLSVQFYRLPSVTVRRRRVEQGWSLQGDGKSLVGEWRIDTAFPELSDARSEDESRAENR